MNLLITRLFVGDIDKCLNYVFLIKYISAFLICWETHL
nr:MAG TPA: hypothetical protein [Caudoviricetes sp.]